MLLLFKKIALSGNIFLFTTLAFAQVEINNSVLFTNETDSLSQIYNLGIVTDSTDLLKVNNSVTEKLITVKLNGSGNYTFNAPYNGFKLNKGMQLHFEVDTTNTISPSVTFNSTNYPIVYQNGDTIPALKFENKSILRVVFNGNQFRITQYFRISCPGGFVAVNENYCIEINERPPAIYTDAIANCNSIGATLCSWGEWYYVCSNLNGITVFNMADNWEYIDDASDHTQTYAIVGAPGFGGCLGFTSENVNNFNRNYRCCYRK